MEAGSCVLVISRVRRASCYDDAAWTKVSLPHAFNEAEAFKVSISQLSDTIVWYRKHFNIGEIEGRKFFIELEGVRFGADLWLNGHHIGLTENGVMASGFDLTPYIMKGANVLAVRCDNSWNYHERATGSTFQLEQQKLQCQLWRYPEERFSSYHGKGLSDPSALFLSPDHGRLHLWYRL